MRIVILGSVALPVPPIGQGGTERIAYYQALGLSQKGYQTTLIAAKGSRKEPQYNLIEIGGGDTVVGTKSATGSNGFTEGSRLMRKELVYMAEVAQWLIAHKDDYDLVLNNMRGGESTLVPLLAHLQKKFVTVMHLPLFAELASLFREFQTPVITISNAQRQGFEGLRYVGTVYNCVDLAEYTFTLHPKDYVLMMGSIAPHKNQKMAIQAATAAGVPLVIAGKIGNQAYYDEEVKPLLSPTVTIVGELGSAEKRDLYGYARAFLFPIQWEEPFGLVMIEAMASGTPVVAFRRGAVPEVVLDGETGYIADDIDGLINGIKKIDMISRKKCREYVEANFTPEKMIDSLDAAIQALA